MYRQQLYLLNYQKANDKDKAVRNIYFQTEEDDFIDNDG